MSLVDLIVSINKISLLAFFITLGFLGYEFYLFKKEKESKSKPIVPNFNENLTLNNTTDTNNFFRQNKPKKIFKTNPLILIILLILLLIFGGLSIVGFISIKETSVNPAVILTPTPKIIYKRASGIKIFDENFIPLNEVEMVKIKPQTKLIIGIDKISGMDIDKARIRVNKNQWELTDITEKFDSSKNIFYIEYIIASEESQLKIEAQLHSKSEGWLGN